MLKCTVKLVQGGNLLSVNKFYSHGQKNQCYLFCNAETWPMWKIYLVTCHSILNKFYCIMKIELNHWVMLPVARVSINIYIYIYI
jgi:hypothetical protein